MNKLMYFIVYHIQNILSKEYHDEFITRLRQVNTGLIRKGNAFAFHHALKNIPDGDILEIGTFTGCTANLIFHFCQMHKKNARVITCDPWDYSFKNISGKSIPLSQLNYNDWAIFVRDTARNNTNFFSSKNINVIQADSLSVIRAWSAEETLTDLNGQEVGLKGRIAFAFIDGNHDYEPVKADLEAVLPLIAPGGYIFFDDSAWVTGSPGVRRLMAEKQNWAASAGLELIGRYPNLLFRKKL